MPTILERCNAIWNTVKEGPVVVPARVAIPVDHTDQAAVQAFKRNEHYFQVRVNELYLTYARKWFATYVPMVLVLSEFIYDRQEQAVPFVVGPAILEGKGIEVPGNAMIFSNTRVAGLHPYRGGRLTTSVILYAVQRDNFADKLLKVVESAASALDFSTTLSSYLKVANAVMDGVEALLGLKQTVPIVGLRKELDPDAGDTLAPGYFALFDAPDTEVDAKQLWVKNDQLLVGNSLDSAKPYRSNDYVLYSLAQTAERGDPDLLPFQTLWDRVHADASQPTDEHWKSAKANMLSLFQTISASPDLTASQASALTDGYIAKMKVLHEKAVSLSTLSGTSFSETMKTPEEEAEDVARSKSVTLLDL
jgi:hypothetical protein